MSITRRFPHNLDAEASVLGGILIRGDMSPAVRHLDERDFFDPKHQAIWSALCRLDARNTPIDAVTVEAELLAMGKLRPIGGLSYLSALSLRVPTAENAAHYASIVHSLADARRLMYGLSGVVESGYELAAPHDMAARAQHVLRSVEQTGSRFVSAAERIMGEAEERAALVARELRFNVTFLDDFLRGILPRDLLVVGARTGAGKTQLAQIIAQTNAQAGKHVYVMALEAEPSEIERRTKYAVLARLAHELRYPGRERLNYPDWYRGQCADVIGPYEPEADAWIAQRLNTLYTLYRGRDFTMEHIEQQFRAIRDKADLIILDHLHYVDSEDPNENRAVKNIVKRIRDVSLAIGVPVIVVAHLRKQHRGHKRLTPELDDFHGTSDITKIATAVVLLSHARDQEPEYPWIANTYLQIPKSRMGGASPYVAMCGFNLRRNAYEQDYALGRLSLAGDSVNFIEPGDYPRWARHASPVPRPGAA